MHKRLIRAGTIEANVADGMANSDSTIVDGIRRICVVDDDQSVREMLVRVLVGDGYAAWSAASGGEALAITAAITFDLVLLDLGMPGKDGWETFEALNLRDPRLAVIVITARPNQRTTAQALGVSALFEKPLNFPKLLQEIRRLLVESTDPRRNPETAPVRAAAPHSTRAPR